MSNSRSPVDVLIVGGGIIGLTVALKASTEGMSVMLLERGQLGQGASSVAAGMLAPVAEAEYGQSAKRVLALGMHSARLWPRFVSELELAASVEVGFRQTGTLLLARDDDEARELERQLALCDSLGLEVRRLRASQARSREPALAPTVRLAAEAPDDHSVDPRLVMAALRIACEQRGASIREQEPVVGIEVDRRCERVVGVRSKAGELHTANVVVLAGGAWSGRIEGLLPQEQIPIRPVKGQIMRLRDPSGPGLLSRVVRFEGGYLVPRGDGQYVLGASVEERGFDCRPTAGVIYELLREAHELIPGVTELQIEEINVGLRPGTPDNAPVIGAGAIAGLIWATGHYRNGVLLAPLTGKILAGLLTGNCDDELAELASMCAPTRFADSQARHDAIGVLR